MSLLQSVSELVARCGAFDLVVLFISRPQAKKLKLDLDIPDVLTSENLPSDAAAHFSIALRCWRLLHSEMLHNGN